MKIIFLYLKLVKRINTILIKSFFKFLYKGKVYIGKRTYIEDGFKFITNNKNFNISIGNDLSIRRNFTLVIEGDAELKMGNNVFFNNQCSINILERIEIGDNVLFGENVKIYDHNHKYSDTSKPIYEQGFSTSKVKIGSNVWIGSNVTILKGVTIGDNSIIGANTLIFKSIPNNSVVKLEQKLSIESKEL